MRTVVTIAPNAALAPFVREFTVVDTTEETNCLLMPDGGIEVGFRYSGHAAEFEGGSARRLPDMSLTGVRHRARRVRTSAGGGIVLARFSDGGLAQFFREPLHELFGATIALEEMARRDEIDRVQSRLVHAAGAAERVSIVEQFFLARLQDQSPDQMVDAAVRAIRATHGAVRIGALAKRLGVSHDWLEKRFRRAVGASPKQLATIVRLHRALDSYQPGRNLADLAAEAGYSDQSHFTREFRAAVGEPPKRYFSVREGSLRRAVESPSADDAVSATCTDWEGIVLPRSAGRPGVESAVAEYGA